MARLCREILAERDRWLAPLIHLDLETGPALESPLYPYIQEAAIALYNARHLTLAFNDAEMPCTWNKNSVSVADISVPVPALLSSKTCTDIIGPLVVMGQEICANTLYNYDKPQKNKPRRLFSGQLFEYQVDGSLLEVRMFGSRTELCSIHPYMACMYNFYSMEFLHDEWKFAKHWPHLDYYTPKLKGPAIRKIIRS